MDKNKQNTLTIISIFVLAFSMLVSAYQAYETRHHDKLIIKPLLRFYYQTDDALPDAGLKIENLGFGPAIIKKIKIFVDRKPVKDWSTAADYCKINKADNNFTWIEYDKEDVVEAGESVFLFSQPTKSKLGLNDLIECVDKKIGILVNYCSIDDDCQTECSSEGLCN